MGNYKPFYSRSVAPPKSARDRDYPEWGKLLATLLDPDDLWFARIYAEAHRIEQYGVEITEDLLRNILLHVHQDVQEMLESSAEASAKWVAEHDDPVVYYMRISDRVKIGTTVNLKQRLATLNPEELLATEPGGYDIEQKRHRQFAKLHSHGEWFRYEDDLKDHIEGLKTAPVDE